jgi:hypothetical protein
MGGTPVNLARRIERLEEALRSGARTIMVEYFPGCESRDVAAARAETREGPLPVVVDLAGVADAEPLPDQDVIVLLPNRARCRHQGTPHEHLERRIDVCPAAMLERLQDLAAMSDLEMTAMLADVAHGQEGFDGDRR